MATKEYLKNEIIKLQIPANQNFLMQNPDIQSFVQKELCILKQLSVLFNNERNIAVLTMKDTLKQEISVDLSFN